MARQPIPALLVSRRNRKAWEDGRMAQNCSSRRGISLMEVLISMFVLAIGLLGVAALIPAGKHEIVEATKLETAAMVGRNAFREIQTRGYLNPTTWRDDYTYGNPGT